MNVIDMNVIDCQDIERNTVYIPRLKVDGSVTLVMTDLYVPGISPPANFIKPTIQQLPNHVTFSRQSALCFDNWFQILLSTTFITRPLFCGTKQLL